MSPRRQAQCQDRGQIDFECKHFNSCVVISGKDLSVKLKWLFDVVDRVETSKPARASGIYIW